MIRSSSTQVSRLLCAFVLASAGAFAQQYLVKTSASASPNGGGSGTVSYDGTTASQSLSPGSATINYSNAPNTPNLTAATSQITVTNQLSQGPAVASAYASANLATGTIGAMGSGTFSSTANDGNGDATVLMLDTLTFNIPGATSTTVTNLPVNFVLNGSATSQGPAYGFLRSMTVKFGNAIVQETYDTADMPPDLIVQSGGWASLQIVSLTENLYSFSGVYALTGPNPSVTVLMQLGINCQAGICDYSHTGAISMTLPAGVTYTSASGAFLSTPPPVCNITLSAGGQGFGPDYGSGTFNVTAPTGCAWTVTGAPSWISFSSASSGSGNGTVNYTVQSNTGGERLAQLSIEDATYTIEQEALSFSGFVLIGSMPHVASEDGWTTSFTLVNKGTSAAMVDLAQFGFSGSPLAVPIALPQQSITGLVASSIEQTIAPNASFIVQDMDTASTMLQEGSAELYATGTVDGFAIFHYDPTNQEAVVALETRNAPSYLLAFDNTNGVVTGVAVGNPSEFPANIPMTIRDDTGTVVTTGTVNLPADGHTSFVLSNQYPQTANIRGTIELDLPPSEGQFSALGIRYTPPGTTTTIPALANVGTTGGLMAHLAVGSGWETTFVLVNTGSAAATANLAFFDKPGNPLPLPLAFPQNGGGVSMTASTYSQLIPANASLWIQSTLPAGSTLSEGSAQLTTNGNISGFVIFRYNPNGQEAVVPLESRNAGSYLIAYDNTSGTATGIAISAASSLAISIPIVLRDDTGAVLSGGGFELLGANGHDSFLLATKFPQTAGIRGTIEFDTPTGSAISVLGIRTPPALTFTTLPALAK